MITDDDTIARLARLRPTEPSDGTAVEVAADVRRGRRAAAQRRRTVAGVALGTAAVVVTATAVVTAGLLWSPAGPEASTPPSAPIVADETELRLVSYAGDQPAGYALETIPEGFVVDESTPSSLILRPETIEAGEAVLYEDEIYVYAESEERHPDGVAGFVDSQPTSLGDFEATLFYFEVGDGEPANRGIAWHVPERGGWVFIQVGTEVRLTDAQLVELASGITLTADMRLLGT